MPDDKLDHPAPGVDSSIASTTEGSQTMTNGTNGHASVVQDPLNAIYVLGSAKSDKVRPPKAKAQRHKSSAGKAPNGAKSNGSKIPKDKRSQKSKASNGKANEISDAPLTGDDRLPDLVDAAATPTVASSQSEDLAPSSYEAAPLPVQAAPSAQAAAPISFSTTMPEDGESIVRKHRDARHFVRDNLASLILGLISICLAVALVVTMLELTSKNALESARTSALAAARNYSVEIASYNYQHLNQDFGAVMADSTPSWQRDYSQASNDIKSILVKFDSSAQATILSAGLVSATTTRAVAVVFLEQTITNSEQRTPSSTRSQIEMTLDYSKGKWLIDDVTLF